MARSRTYNGSVTVDIDVDDVLTEISDDLLKKECVSRGILPKSASPTTPAAAVSFGSDEIDDVRRLIQRGDLEGGMLLLDRVMPPEFRVFSSLVERGGLQ